MEDFKIKNLTPEQSRLIQETVFNNGGTWRYGGAKIRYLDSPILHLKDGILTHSRDTKDFNNNLKTEITFEEFERKYITKLPPHISELPYVEMEVRDDDNEDWQVRKVVTLLDSGCCAMSKDGERLTYWRKYRTIKPKTTLTKQQIAEKFGVKVENLIITE